MSVVTRITVLNARPLEVWLAAAPAAFTGALRLGTLEGTDLMAHQIQEDTPVRTGTLLESIGSDVVEIPEGAIGQVFSSGVGYAPLVEHGTRQHGPARHMFEYGFEQASPAIEEIFHIHIEPLVQSFGNV